MGKANREVMCCISKGVTTVDVKSYYNGRLPFHLSSGRIYVPTLKSGWFDDGNKNDFGLPARLLQNQQYGSCLSRGILPLSSQVSGCEEILYAGIPGNNLTGYCLPVDPSGQASEQGSL